MEDKSDISWESSFVVVFDDKWESDRSDWYNFDVSSIAYRGATSNQCRASGSS